LKMNRTSLVVLLAASMAATIGCSSKNYVRQQTTPLINKTNELDDMTAKNSKDIKDVETRAMAGIQQVTTKAAEVEQKAQADADIECLAAENQIPAYKIYVVGLGKDKPVESNKTAQGRAKNRRVDVRLMTNTQGETPAQQPSAANTANPPSM